MNDDTLSTATCPPLRRGPMPRHPWTDPWRGLLQCWRGRDAPHAYPPAPPWQAAARRRRAVLLALVSALTLLAWSRLPEAHAAASHLESALRMAQHLLFVLLFAWIGVGFATAVMGAWVMWRGDRHALRPCAPHGPIDAAARTAIVMPICNEDIATVFGGLSRTCHSLAATGALRLFDFYILSDSTDPALRAAELRAWARLRAQLGDAPIGAGGRLYYRWRRRRGGRKAGNVADFCRRWGRNYRYMVVLDADSTMRGDTLVQLVRLMQAHPRAGILQTLPQALGHDTLHARVQQFAARVGARLYALGMAWWQLGDSHYWGHNAILRVAPFMAHCGLARLPGRGGLGGEILSHDFVEAALMGRAGYEVWLLPQLGGSWEQHPANLLDELQRDRRWCQGNLQNLRLIGEPGWRAAHRAMFATGALSYLTSPLWLAFIVLGLLTLAGGAPAPALGGLWALTLMLLLGPRVLGVAAAWRSGRARDHGGLGRLLGGAGVEALWSALLAPVRMLAHSAFVVGALTGLRLEWRSPPRDAVTLRWRDALSRVGAPAAAALAVVLLLTRADPATQPWLLPLLTAWLLAVPLTVWGSRAGSGRRLRHLGLLQVSRDADAPQVVVPAAAARPAAVARQLWRPALLLGGVALAVAVALPRPVLSPELPAALHAEFEQRHLVMQEMRRLGAAPPLRAADRTQPLRLLAPSRPARYIDDAVRRRALDAVARALATG